MSKSQIGESWDVEYGENRKYEGEPPVAFVNTILEELGEEGKSQLGLYVGCGNGRNYIPMLDEGLTLHGIDVSSEGIHQIQEARPDAKVLVREFTSLHQANIWDYLISIQVFQHGNSTQVEEYFKKAQGMLKTFGKLFLTVNSISTKPHYRHKTTEGNNTRKGRRVINDGKTIRYEDGPKKGQEIHFFTANELGRIATDNGFGIILQPREVVHERKPPATGTYTQWEAIWQKNP